MGAIAYNKQAANEIKRELRKMGKDAHYKKQSNGLYEVWVNKPSQSLQKGEEGSK